MHFRKLRHTVLIANSRGPETLFEVAQKTGAIPVAIRDAAKGVDLLVITIPMKSVLSLPKNLLSDLPLTSPIIDTGNYNLLRDGVINEIKGAMVESEWTSQALGRPLSRRSTTSWRIVWSTRVYRRVRRAGSPFQYQAMMPTRSK